MDHNNSEPMPSPTSPPVLDPPFRGYIETTYDALLVFEAARRGMIPRVTRRLIERERGMVQSGAVFVFDEHESGIKRWTDGLVWSPSRILGNFLVSSMSRAGETCSSGIRTCLTDTFVRDSTRQVYRETDKRRNSNNGNDQPPSLPYNSSPQVYPQGGSSQDLQSISSRPGLSAASITGLDLSTPRSRCASDAQPGESLDKNRERQLVGSLTNSYKFKEGGLVKKVSDRSGELVDDGVSADLFVSTRLSDHVCQRQWVRTTHGLVLLSRRCLEWETTNTFLHLRISLARDQPRVHAETKFQVPTRLRCRS
jgi:hypothetical protein